MRLAERRGRALSKDILTKASAATPTGSARPSSLFRFCLPRYPLYYLFLRVLPLSETKPDRIPLESPGTLTEGRENSIEGVVLSMMP